MCLEISRPSNQSEIVFTQSPIFIGIQSPIFCESNQKPNFYWHSIFIKKPNSHWHSLSPIVLGILEVQYSLAPTRAQYSFIGTLPIFIGTRLSPITIGNNKAQYSLASSKTQYPLAFHEDQYSLAHSNQYPFKAQYSLANTKPNLHWHPKTNLHWQLPEAPIFNGTYQAISISIDIQNPIFIGAHPKPNLHWNSMLNFH
jgi:hypothetical protein